MERRDFIKISAITGATAALDSCGQPDVELIRFIPEEELTPGVATWKPSICTLCPAGCGTLVKVMEGDAEVLRNGQRGLIKMGLAKKIEGNPKHPISQGRLCPRGQAMLQVTYHPDRIKGPLKRTGPRGSGQFQEISWDEAIKELMARLGKLRSSKLTGSLRFLTKPLRGQRQRVIEGFLQAFGAPPPVSLELFDESVLGRANALCFGRPQLPTFDLANSNYVISFGADFLGTWNSPVAQSVAYGMMRQGRPGQRGKFVMVEPRLSLTGASADEWVPVRPGTEGVLALSLAHVMMRDKLRVAADAGHPGSLLDGWDLGLPYFAPEEAEKMTGVEATRIARLAHEIATHTPSVAMIGGAPLATNEGLFNAVAVNALNALLGSVEKPGGIFFTPRLSLSGPEPTFATGQMTSGFAQLLDLLPPKDSSTTVAVQALLLYEANPAYQLGTGWEVPARIQRIPFIASFGSFFDDTSVFADLVLPDHSPLESWLDDVPESGTPQAVMSLAPPAMRPLHNTRAMPDVILEVAHQLGGDFNKVLPCKSYEEVVRGTFGKLHSSYKLAGTKEEAWDDAVARGGWWDDHIKQIPATLLPRVEKLTPFGAASADNTEKRFPLRLLPYPSQLHFDGTLAHLPWLQETPDPLSTVMWGSWVEINPETAMALSIQQGNIVEVVSPYGRLQAHALITPAIAPDVIAMPIGQGHASFTRYASERGANPLVVVAGGPMGEEQIYAWAATRVKVTKVGEGKLTLFGAELREHPHERR
jgi:anaerobic selenocysteine-containing dehydrogenase